MKSQKILYIDFKRERQGFQMQERAVLIALAACMAATALTGCSVFNRTHGYNDRKYEVTVEKSSSRLEDGSYYVMKSDGTFHRLYIGETSFGNSRVAASASAKRVAWFGKDAERIPTMYRGESIAYRSSAEFSENFHIERFEDTGYTIGICGMKESGTGRYRFSTAPENMQIDMNASTGVLYRLGDHTATMDRIGDIELRRGNISRAGTVVGLERGKTYATEVYIGTEVREYSFVADVRALVSSEVCTLSDYSYTQGNTVSIVFPDWFHSGYYFVGGYGIVRYVASGREFSENMDMNIPNDPARPVDDDNGTDGTAEAVRFRTDREEEITVQVTFEPANGDGYGSVPGPSAKVIGENAVYSLSPGKEGELTATAVLPAGDYTLEITGLNGRAYNYRVTRKGDQDG